MRGMASLTNIIWVVALASAMLTEVPCTWALATTSSSLRANHRMLHLSWRRQERVGPTIFTSSKNCLGSFVCTMGLSSYVPATFDRRRVPKYGIWKLRNGIPAPTCEGEQLGRRRRLPIRAKLGMVTDNKSTSYLSSLGNSTCNEQTSDTEEEQTSNTEEEEEQISNTGDSQRTNDEEEEQPWITEEDIDDISEEESEMKEENFKAAVQEVQDAVQEVQESTNKLKEAIIQKGPEISSGYVKRKLSREFWSDCRRRRKWYVADWTDGFKRKRKVIPAILFLYFACLAPAVSFGTIASQLTDGSIGVVEFLLGSGFGGMAYSILCGQPMAFIAPTGLTLAFISGLFSFCSLKNIPFFPVYAWVGLWTSLFMIMLGVAGSSRFIRLCTHFTDEVFNALLSVTFIYEAAHSLQRNFEMADPMNLTMPFTSLAMALGTFFSTMKVNAISRSMYFNDKVRASFKDFGPVSVIVIMTLLNQHPWFRRIQVPTLSVPAMFELAGGRNFLVPLSSIPLRIRLLCSLPAILLTSLFYMDQNISVRLVNKPTNKLRKGEAYNLDMVALGLVTGGLSLVGLPWMCGATVQSMNHVRAMSTTVYSEETQQEEVTDVTETRLTGFLVHSMIAASIYLLPLLKFLPIPVVSGVFLFLGRKLMTGNSFLQRIRDSIAESSRLPSEHPIHVLGRTKMNLFTGLQIACLVGLWTFKQCTATAIFFPSVIGLLMLIRSFLLPKFFSEEEFVALGDPTPTWK